MEEHNSVSISLLFTLLCISTDVAGDTLLYFALVSIPWFILPLNVNTGHMMAVRTCLKYYTENTKMCFASVHVEDFQVFLRYFGETVVDIYIYFSFLFHALVVMIFLNALKWKVSL